MRSVTRFMTEGLSRSHPDDPSESKPTGKVRQIQYKLQPGEAGWLLKADKVVEF
jgi:hypothetical protein